MGENSNRKMRGKRKRKIVLFISAKTSGADGTNSKTLKPFRVIEQWILGPDTNIVELLKFLFNDCQPKTIGFRVSTSSLGHLHG